MNADKLLEYFESLFGKNPKCELEFETDIQCLVAIILSAQCTDKRVNIVTKDLFKKYKTVNDFANADLKEIERDIYSTGFYHNKAKNIIAASNEIVKTHGGKVPTEFDTLTKLSGVGRKTAGVFFVEFLKKPAFPVDTHVKRTANRLGITTQKTPDKIETDLKKFFNEKDWGRAHLYLVLFGRYVCIAKNPKCAECKIKNLCKELS
jgi:endonuclease-3